MKNKITLIISIMLLCSIIVIPTNIVARNIISTKPIDANNDGIVDGAEITYGIHDEEISTKNKTLKCLYKDYNGYYDGISLQLIIDVKAASNGSTAIIEPRFYFPDSVVKELQDNRFLNDDKEYDYVENNNQIWKSIYDGIGYDNSTYLNKTNDAGHWKTFLSKLNVYTKYSNGKWYEKERMDIEPHRTYGYTYYGNNQTGFEEINNVYLSLYKEFGELTEADIASLIVDGEFQCPRVIGTLIPSEKEEIEKQYTQKITNKSDLFLMGYYDKNAYAYQSKVIIPDLVPNAPWGDYVGAEKEDKNGQLIYTGQGNWSDLDEFDSACFHYDNYDTWSDYCLLDRDYGVIYFPLTYSYAMEYTETEKEELKEEETKDEESYIQGGPEALKDYCSDLEQSGMSIGSDQNRINTTSCYYKVYSKEETLNDIEIYPHTYNGATYICKADAGFIQYKENDYCTSLYAINHNIGYGTQPYGTADVSTCVNFWSDSNESYIDTNINTVCSFDKASKYYCACEFVGKCKDTYTEGETVNYYDCSKCTGYVDPCPKGETVEPVCDFIGPNTMKILKRIVNIIKILIPVLVIVLGMIDFLKVVVSGEEKSMKSAWNSFLKRVIFGVAFMLLPSLLDFILNLFGFKDKCLELILTKISF